MTPDQLAKHAARQRKMRREHKAKGLCSMCCSPSWGGTIFCAEHLMANRKKVQARLGLRPHVPGGRGNKTTEERANELPQILADLDAGRIQ